MTFGIQMVYKHIALQFDIEFYLVLCCKFQRLFIFRSPTETEDETITCCSSSRNGYDFMPSEAARISVMGTFAYTMPKCNKNLSSDRAAYLDTST